jgi:hypothetical protein
MLQNATIATLLLLTLHQTPSLFLFNISLFAIYAPLQLKIHERSQHTLRLALTTAFAI